jgi:hypothetical protein
MVIKMLQIKTYNSSISVFLDQYQLWKDYRKFYKNDTSDPVVQAHLSGIPCFHYTNVMFINQCQEPIVVIDCMTEGKNMQYYFNQYTSDKHYIIFTNESHCSQQDLGLKISLSYTWISYYFFLVMLAIDYNSPLKFSSFLDKEYKFYNSKPMRFISTTGSVRDERTYLKNQLLKNIKYKNFIFRYSGVDFGQPSDQFDVIKTVPGKFDPHTAILAKYQHAAHQTLPIDMYNQANFNLVVETDIDYEYGFFLTEKTVKCLITGMPFLTLATPHFLKHLRELGFHTYGELWDESYDDELDYIKRVDKIVDLCNTLDQFDWESNQAALELIALKNKCNFLNLNQIMDKVFQPFEQSIRNLPQ